jgi:hypothetical protein
VILDLAIICDAPDCRRGVIWGENFRHRLCPFCGGKGSISLGALCRRIGEHDSTMRRLFEPQARMRPMVAARICGKLVELFEPGKRSKAGKQKEMFA